MNRIRAKMPGTTVAQKLNQGSPRNRAVFDSGKLFCFFFSTKKEKAKNKTKQKNARIYYKTSEFWGFFTKWNSFHFLGNSHHLWILLRIHLSRMYSNWKELSSMLSGRSPVLFCQRPELSDHFWLKPSWIQKTTWLKRWSRCIC